MTNFHKLNEALNSLKAEKEENATPVKKKVAKKKVTKKKTQKST